MVVDQLEPSSLRGRTLTLRDLESHLWQAANILRGKIDSSDFKHYIFALLFYKRLCDVWTEENEPGREAPDPITGSGRHRYQIPAKAAWTSVRRHKNSIGLRLNEALRAIESGNSRLRGVFRDVDFSNKARFPDSTLEELLLHFEKYSLRHADVEPDMLGSAYEYLIGQFADDAGKKGGEFYTPKSVVQLLVECLRPESGMSIYDPACGSGGMLLEAMQSVARRGQDPRSLRLYGQEMNLNTWTICQMNLLLHDIENASVMRGDTLRHPMHAAGQRLMTFDRVLANPPFSLKNWGHETWRHGDAFGRDVFGCPPKSYGDLAFLQHMLATLAPRGMLGVVMPHGALFRGGSEMKIRRGIIEADLVEAVIGLPPNLFYGTSISACLLILRRQKPTARKQRILFVDGSAHFTKGTNQNRLSEKDVKYLAKAYHEYSSSEPDCRIVDQQEIEGNDFSLNLSTYISVGHDVETIDTPEVLDHLIAAHARRDRATERLRSYLEALGYRSTLDSKSD